MRKFTIFGGNGFIGGALASHLRAAGHDVVTPQRDEIPSPGTPLGHVVYAIGLTGDFRSRPLDTVEAHVGGLADRLREAACESFLYLSSTRVYGGLDVPLVSEDMTLRTRPDRDGIYDLSKLLGEALCLSMPQETIRAGRVANVYGPGAHANSFLGMLLDDVAAARPITIGEAPDSAKDYIAIEDLCRMIERVALGGRHRLYNLASGESVPHGAIAETIQRICDVPVAFAANGPARRFPDIDVSRIAGELDTAPQRLLNRLPDLIEQRLLQRA